MGEILPQVIYTQEGLLQVRTALPPDLAEDENVIRRHAQLLEQLTEGPGISVDDEKVAHVEVRQALGKNFGYERGGAVHNFLALIGWVTPGYVLNDDLDRVAGPQFLGPDGLRVAVFPHLQRWLNTQTELSEDVARDTLLAMAVPFGADKEKEAKREFGLYGHVASAMYFDLKIPSGNFGISSSEETDEAWIEKAGRVRWNWLDMSTLGSCACLGPTGQERERINFSPGNIKPWLYEMSDHNIDFAQQTLSLLMGVGSLARYATEYAGREDILAHAAWQEPRIIPK